MSKYVNINALSWNRFLTRFLEIAPELMGKSHLFQYNQHNITITLPIEDIAELIINEHPQIDNETKVALVSWRQDGDTKIPLSLQVQSVDVTIEIPQAIQIKEDILFRSPNAYDLITDSERKHLDELSDTYNQLAEIAFEHWLRILRWKSRNGSIGQPLVRNYQSGWSTNLMDCTEKKHFWIKPHTINAMIGKPISLQLWEDIENSLKSGEQAPLYFDIFFDGNEHWKLKDYQRAIVDFAVASEVFMRSKVMSRIPSGLMSSMVSYIDDANIRYVMSKFFPNLLSPIGQPEFKRLSKNLHKLFDARNSILHSGKLLGSLEKLVKDFQETSKQLIYFDDHQEYWLQDYYLS